MYIWERLTLLGLVFAALFAIPTSLFLREVAGGLASSVREADGMDRATQVLALMRAVSVHRTLSGGLVAGDESLAKPQSEARRDGDKRFGELQAQLGGGPRARQKLGLAMQSLHGIVDS